MSKVERLMISLISNSTNHRTNCKRLNSIFKILTALCNQHHHQQRCKYLENFHFSRKHKIFQVELITRRSRGRLTMKVFLNFYELSDNFFSEIRYLPQAGRIFLLQIKSEVQFELLLLFKTYYLESM